MQLIDTDCCCSSNPVTVEDVRRSLGKLGIVPQSADEDDFSKLLATTHDIAKTVEEFPDYEPPSGLERFPRKNIQRPSAEQQNFGAAWAHTFSIKDPSITGPLAGKTVALKDCIAVAQVPQLLGTEIIEPWTPKSDATVVTWLLENGAELVGTANCEDWCQTTASFSSAHGIVDNPYSVGYSAGGSSSGCAALVAGGIVDISIGADQGGSIRVPAALCGCKYSLLYFPYILPRERKKSTIMRVPRCRLETNVRFSSVHRDCKQRCS